MKNCVIMKINDKPIEVLDVRVFSPTELTEMKKVCLENKEAHEQQLTKEKNMLRTLIDNLQEQLDKQQETINNLLEEVKLLKGE